MCNNTYRWHLDNHPRHPFAELGGVSTFDLGSPGKRNDDESKEDSRVIPMTMPFDPVLRMVLIDKGVITVADLDAADAKIKHLTRGVSDG
jgi:hypothetical protein